GIGNVRVEEVYPKEKTIAAVTLQPVDCAIGDVPACVIFAEPSRQGPPQQERAWRVLRQSLKGTKAVFAESLQQIASADVEIGAEGASTIAGIAKVLSQRDEAVAER